ncbi:MAG: PilZ domain-containing protein [Enterobacterales bacterium]|nr:PilZ domain-containing protein [Enterobacterales bacterium]
MNDSQGTKLKLANEFHTDMQLEIPGMHGRFKSKLCGVVNEEILIFQISPKYVDAIRSLTKDNTPTVTVRGISRGRAFGFKGASIKFIIHPKALLLVAYPTKIQTQIIRASQRVKCLLPCKFSKEDTEISGVIADISSSGCHFKTHVDIDEAQAEAMQLSNEVTMVFTLPGKDKEITINAIIRNTFSDDEKIDIGFQFDGLTDDDRLAIKEYIDLSFDLEPF